MQLLDQHSRIDVWLIVRRQRRVYMIMFLPINASQECLHDELQNSELVCIFSWLLQPILFVKTLQCHEGEASRPLANPSAAKLSHAGRTGRL
jgi:hypothetical protein